MVGKPNNIIVDLKNSCYYIFIIIIFFIVMFPSKITIFPYCESSLEYVPHFINFFASFPIEPILDFRKSYPLKKGRGYETIVLQWLLPQKNNTAQKMKFPLRISHVNVTKFAANCGFGHIYWRDPWWKTSFFVQYHLMPYFNSYAW